MTEHTLLSRRCRLLSGLVLVAFAAASAFAQDSRVVHEPIVPKSCAVLKAITQSLQEADDTRRIQQAIDQCPAGQAVELMRGTHIGSFLSGPLVLKSGVTLLVDAGTVLYATPDPLAYDRGSNSCGINDHDGKACKPFIAVENGEGGGIMGNGVIDGQGGHVMTGKQESWWQLSRRAQKERTTQNVPQLIVVAHTRGFALYGITLRNSLKFHVVLNEVDGFTAWGVHIDTPADARNTDGIDPISSRNISIVNSFIRAGDDNVAIKSGSAGPSENISILHNHFYSGHGMSIGSNTDGGVRHVLVGDLSMDGTTSGLRIKSDVSRGGLVQDIRYRNVCLRNVRAPIDIDSTYDPQAQGSRLPLYRDISLQHVHSLTGGRIILHGLDAEHALEINFDDVVIDEFPVVDAKFTHLALGPGPVQPVPSGLDVSTQGKPGAGTGFACEKAFPPFAVTMDGDIQK